MGETSAVFVFGNEHADADRMLHVSCILVSQDVKG
jgi:hypothetical protein